MRRLDARDIFAILFVIAGALPVAWWLGSWLYHSMNPGHVVQAVLIIIVLYLAFWIRKRFEKK
jgi:hypothetical protein